MARSIVDSCRRWWAPEARADEDPLLALLREAEPWAHQRVAIPDLTRQVLLTLTPLMLAWAIVLASILTGNTDCQGRLCAAATLHNPPPLLVAATVAVVLLVVIGIRTRGFAAADRREAGGLTVAAAASLVALLGVAAVISLAAAVLAVLFAFFGALTLKP